MLPTNDTMFVPKRSTKDHMKKINFTIMKAYKWLF